MTQINEKIISHSISRNIWEKDFEMAFGLKCLVPPPSRRLYMKNLFYNIKDFNLLKSLTKNERYVSEGTKFLVKTETRELGIYQLVCSVIGGWNRVETVSLLKSSIIEEYGGVDNFISSYETYEDLKKENCYDNDNLIFVVSEREVINSLYALYDFNKHIVDGYESKTITIKSLRS